MSGEAAGHKRYARLGPGPPSPGGWSGLGGFCGERGVGIMLCPGRAAPALYPHSGPQRAGALRRGSPVAGRRFPLLRSHGGNGTPGPQKKQGTVSTLAFFVFRGLVRRPSRASPCAALALAASRQCPSLRSRAFGAPDRARSAGPSAPAPPPGGLAGRPDRAGPPRDHLRAPRARSRSRARPRGWPPAPPRYRAIALRQPFASAPPVPLYTLTVPLSIPPILGHLGGVVRSRLWDTLAM